MDNALELSWNTHWMRWEFDPAIGEPYVLIDLKKEKGSKETKVSIPPFIKKIDVEEAWHIQDRDWLKLANTNIPQTELTPQLYFGGRLLHFARHDHSLMWWLFHFDQIPIDSFGFQPMTRALLDRIRALNAW